MSTNSINNALPKSANITLWVIQGLLAASFIMAGGSKLFGQQMMVDNFDTIGLGQWFRYLTGTIEVVAAVLLVVPKFTSLGAGLLVCTMIGAAVAHFTVLGGSAVPPIVLGAMAAVVLVGRSQLVFKPAAARAAIVPKP